MEKDTPSDRTCARVWLLYLQGRLSPVQLLALCKLPTTASEPETAV
ncbi:MAG: hypothetical protein ACFB2W_12895 [Leptolyngbyaceae cyanobacterium]